MVTRSELVSVYCPCLAFPLSPLKQTKQLFLEYKLVSSGLPVYKYIRFSINITQLHPVGNNIILFLSLITCLLSLFFMMCLLVQNSA